MMGKKIQIGSQILSLKSSMSKDSRARSVKSSRTKRRVRIMVCSQTVQVKRQQMFLNMQKLRKYNFCNVFLRNYWRTHCS